MLEMKFIRENREEIARGLAKKGVEADLDRLIELDEQRRSLLAQSEQLKARRNKANQAIPRQKGGGKPDPAIITEMKELSSRIKELDGRLAELEPEIEPLLMGLPNLPHESVPVGASEKDNLEIKKWGEARNSPSNLVRTGKSARNWEFLTDSGQPSCQAPGSCCSAAWERSWNGR